MIKIDSHIHYWNYDPVKDAWITDDMKVIQRSFLPQDIQPIIHQHIIDGCIAVQADQSEEETKWLCALAKENHFIKGVIGWIDLRVADIEARLEAYKNEKHLKGFRHIVQAEPDGFLLDEKFRNGISAIINAGYVYEILVYPNQLNSVVEFVKKFPDAKFILDHCGKPGIKNNDYNEWKAQLKILSQFPNLYCKISGLITEADWKNWKDAEIIAVLDFIVEHFGNDRIVFGSDWPVMLLAGTYERWTTLLEKYFAAFSIEEQAKFWSGNAIKFYGL